MSDQIMDLGNDPQGLLIAQKVRQMDITYLLMETHPPPIRYSCKKKKKKNLNWAKSLDPTIRNIGTESHVK